MRALLYHTRIGTSKWMHDPNLAQPQVKRHDKK